MQPNRRINMIFVHGRPGSGKGAQVSELKRTHPELTVIYPGRILNEIQDPTTKLP